MSRKSSRRLREVLIAVPFQEYSGVFVTLTWHNNWSDDPTDWYSCLYALLDALQDRWRGYHVSGIWRKEFQRRGAPHYHLIILSERPLPLQVFRQWVALTWNRIAAPGDLKHLAAGTSADPVRIEKGGYRKLMNYLSSYVAKVEQAQRLDRTTGEILPTGRVWGRFYNLPQVQGIEIGLGWGEWKALGKRVRLWHSDSRYLSAFARRYNNAIIYGTPQESEQLLDNLENDWRLPSTGGP